MVFTMARRSLRRHRFRRELIGFYTDDRGVIRPITVRTVIVDIVPSNVSSNDVRKFEFNPRNDIDVARVYLSLKLKSRITVMEWLLMRLLVKQLVFG